MYGCVSVSYHLPEGFARWKRLVESPALNDLAFRITQWLMMTQPERCSAEAIAAHLGAGRTRVYAALRQMETWGYLRRKRTSGGYGKWLHFWQITDAPGEFPDWPPAAACGVTRIAIRESSQVDSCDRPRQANTGTEPGCSFGERSKTSAVDRPGRPRRARRLPRAFDLHRLPAEDQPYATDALALLEGLCVPPVQRALLAPALAAAIRSGWPLGVLGHYLTRDMGTARDRFRVLRYRLAKLPSIEEVTAGSATGRGNG